jgi:hypothetical protein
MPDIERTFYERIKEEKLDVIKEAEGLKKEPKPAQGDVKKPQGSQPSIKTIINKQIDDSLMNRNIFKRAFDIFYNFRKRCKEQQDKMDDEHK